MDPKDLEEYQELLRERRRRILQDPLALYKPLGHQALFHSNQARERALIGANRSGKSESGTVEAGRYSTGRNPHRKRPVPNVGWIISVSNEAQRGILQPKFEKWIAPYFAKSPVMRGHGIWDYLQLKNGSLIFFKSCEMSVRVFQGADIDYAWFDEEPEYDIFREVKARLLDRKGDLWVTMTPLYGMDWSFDYFVDPTTRSKESFVLDPPPSMWDNAKSRGGHIDDSEVKRFEESIPDPVERRIRVYGEYHTQVGRIYKMWDPTIHLIDALPREFVNADGTLNPNLHYYCALDTGRNFAASFMLCDYLGNLFLFDEYVAQDKPIAEHSRRVLNLWNTYGVWPEFYVDQKSQHKLDLADCNIVCADSWADELSRINAVSEYLTVKPGNTGYKYSNPRLYVVGPKCPNWVRDVQRYQWETPASSGDTQGEPKNKPRKKDDHIIDAVGYVVERRPEAPVPKEGDDDMRPIQRQIRERAKEKIRAKRNGAEEHTGMDPWGLDRD